MFDTQECVEVEDAEVEIEGDGDGRNKHDLRGNKNTLNRRQNGTAGNEEDIELQEMGGHGDGHDELDGAALVLTSRRPSRVDEAVSSGALDAREKRRRESRTLEEEQEEASARDAALSSISNSISARTATFGTHQFVFISRLLL